MTFQDAVRTCLAKYVDFNGRARRPEFWWFALFTVIGSVIAGLIDRMLFGSGIGIFQSIWGLALLLPYVAVAVRRLHDIDRSGWWLLLGLIPVIGALVLVYLYVQSGSRGANRFGAEPRVIKSAT